MTMMYKKLISIAAMLVATHVYSSVFSYLFNAVGVASTTSLMYWMHKQREIGFHDALQSASKVDQTTYNYVMNQAERMPHVNSDDLRNMFIRYDNNNEDTDGQPTAQLTQKSLNSPYCLVLYNFTTAPSTHQLQDQQYMVLAHELGHFYRDEFTRRLWTNDAWFLGSSCIYPCVSYVTRSCIHHPYIRAATVPVIFGTTFFCHNMSCHLWSAYYSRKTERQADMFALQQARSLQQIDAFYKFFEYANSQMLWRYKHSPFIRYAHMSHPHPEERMSYVNAYYQQKQREGWKR